jgi:hypothetical protein
VEETWSNLVFETKMVEVVLPWPLSYTWRRVGKLGNRLITHILILMIRDEEDPGTSAAQ